MNSPNSDLFSSNKDYFRPNRRDRDSGDRRRPAFMKPRHLNACNIMRGRPGMRLTARKYQVAPSPVCARNSSDMQTVSIIEIRSSALENRFLGVVGAKFGTKERAAWRAPQLRDTAHDWKCGSAECATARYSSFSVTSIHDIPPSERRVICAGKVTSARHVAKRIPIRGGAMVAERPQRFEKSAATIVGPEWLAESEQRINSPNRDPFGVNIRRDGTFQREK
jgi:hypothetical protein